MAEPDPTSAGGTFSRIPSPGVRRLGRIRVRPGPDGRPPGRSPEAASGSGRPPSAGRVLGGGDTGRQPADAGTRPVRWTPDAERLELLAALIEAGLPLVDALGTLVGMEGDRTVRAALRHLEQGVRAGGALGPSLTQLGASPHVQMLVAGGERTGRLTAALRSAGVLTARIEALRSTVRRALVYPVVVLVIGLAILTVIAIGVVPPLERTFADLGGELPRATRIVLAASRPLSSPAALGMVAAAAGAVALVRRWSGDGGSARLLGSILPPWWHTTIAPLARRAADHLPLTGRLRRELRLTVIAHVMATLVRGGVPLDVALEHVADGLPSGVTRQALLDAASATRQGTGPVDGRGLGRLLGTAEREMLRVGERHGLLAEQWERVAQRRDAALDDRMVRLGVVMEPLLVALVGAVVGGAVLALYLPTFRVMDLL